MMVRPTLSIVVPVYNEEECLQLLFNGIRAACEQNGLSYEIVFVDDGSDDRTFEFLDILYQQHPRIVVIRFRKNYGQTAAMAAGFRMAQGQYIVSMDGDMQNDPSDIPYLVAKLKEGNDVVCGWRKNRKDAFLSRRVPSLIANWLIGFITGVPIHDNGCSLKAYRADVIKRVALYSDLHRFIPAMSTLAGAKVAELVVQHHPRIFGVSKYGLSRSWRVFLDLIVVKMMTGFAGRPALWFGTFSLISLLLCLLSLFGMVSAGGTGIVWPTIALLFMALSGHLYIMGILAEMLLYSGDYRPEHMLQGALT